MKPLNLRLVFAIGIVSLAFGGLVSALAVRSGSSPLLITPWISVLFAIIGVWLLIGGRAVKRLKARKATWVSPTGAARIAALARVSSYVMGGSAGLLLGVSLVAFTRLWAPSMLVGAWTALAGALTALFACVSAVVVERWCIDDSDDEGSGRGPSRKSAPQPGGN